MKVFVAAALGLGLILAPFSSSFAEDVGVHIGPVGAGVHVGDTDHHHARDHDVVRTRGSDCRMRITKVHRDDGTTITKRERRCD